VSCDESRPVIQSPPRPTRPAGDRPTDRVPRGRDSFVSRDPCIGILMGRDPSMSPSPTHDPTSSERFLAIRRETTTERRTRGREVGRTDRAPFASRRRRSDGGVVARASIDRSIRLIRFESNDPAVRERTNRRARCRRKRPERRRNRR
jgi:hypothetical protein